VRALITGAGGQLAHQLIATAPADVQLKAVSHSECDITNPEAVERTFDSFRPDVVINTAAYTAVDAAEDAPELSFLVNARGAATVAESAERAGARMIHISTDYVFDGKRSTPYPPDAPTNPLNVYGASKLEGERLALAAAPSALVVRVGWLYSKAGKNFLSRIVGGGIASQPLRVVRDQIGCPTSANEFAAAIWRASGTELRGVYHWANVGTTTWYDFALEAERVARELELRGRAVPQIVGVTSEEYPSRARRPRYSVLDPTRLAEALHTSPAAWSDALRAELMRGR
jgi:dTDP-4-dehydrorhamnose reductase